MHESHIQLRHTADKLYYSILELENIIEELIKSNEFADDELKERYETVLESFKIAYKETLTELIKEVCE